MKQLALKALQQFDKACQYLPTIGSFQPQKGWFSAYQELTEGRIEGDVLYPSQEIGPEPKDSITLLSGLNQARFQPWPAFWTKSNDALLLGRTALWRNREKKFCLEAAYHAKDRRKLGEDGLMARSWTKNTQILPGAWTSLTSNWGDGENYFHWLLDNLTRLMVREILPEETRILIPEALPSYAIETLELLGFQNLWTPVSGRPLRPERFYFCSPTAMTGVWNPEGFKWLRQKFSSFQQKDACANPVFFTRRGTSRIPDNLAEIEQIFVSHGFEIVECGRLTVRQQIQKTSAAPAIAGLHGAAMTNILWAHPGTPVMEIFSNRYLNACYEQIALQGGLRYNYHLMSESSCLSGLKKFANDFGEPSAQTNT